MLEYGFRWFEYHAQQRITTFNMFLVIYSGLAAAASYALKEKIHPGSIVLSIMMIALSVLFWQLDVRNRQLIEIGEKLVSNNWKGSGLDDGLNPVAIAGTRQSEGLRYKHLFGTVFLLGSMGGLGIFIYAVAVASV
ncbi:hypothetical protein AAII07_52115 [Microvirga sp. 0TCS3.31]